MKTFKVNGRDYIAREFDFNLVCDLEDMGLSMEAMADKPMSMVRAYFGICSGLSRDEAGKEMEAHLIGGGNLDDVMDAMSEKLEKSDFFQNLSKTEKTEVTENQSKKK